MKKFISIVFVLVFIFTFGMKADVKVSSAAAGTPECSDGIDNNGNGLIDDLDPGCHLDGDVTNVASYDASIWQEAGAGLPCPGCVNVTPIVTPPGGGGGGGGSHICSDNLDNDSDGLVDANDPGCHSDGNASNVASYVSYKNTEVNVPIVTAAPAAAVPQVLGATTGPVCGTDTGRPCTLQKTGGVEVDARTSANRKATTLAVKEDDTLIIPKLGVNKPILQLATNDPLFKEARILPWTSTPDKGGNTVLVGHAYYLINGFYSKSTFYSLDTMKVGDEIEVHWKGVKYVYVVSETKKVKPDQIEIENQTATPTLTIYSCGRFTNLMRNVVVATLKAN